MFKVNLYTQKTHPIVWERPYAKMEALKMLIAATQRKLPDSWGLMVVIPWPKSKLLLTMGSHFTKSSHYLGATSEFNISKRGKRETYLGLLAIHSCDYLKPVTTEQQKLISFWPCLPVCLWNLKLENHPNHSTSLMV